MHLRVIALLVASAATVASALSAPLTAAAERFLVAVVRDDGKLHPFGMVDRGTWKPAWRPVSKTAEVPIRLTDIPSAWLKGVPFSATWMMVPDTGPARPITVTATTWAPAFCRQQVLLESPDAVRSPMRAPLGPFVPKHALATLGGGHVEPLRYHDAASPSLLQLADALAPHVDRVEEWQLRGAYLGVFVHPHSAEERRTYPVSVLNLHEGPGPNGPVFWFDALRRYPRNEGDPDVDWCDIVTYVTGWTYLNAAGDLAVAVQHLSITSCLLDSVVRRVPLGVVRAGTDDTWVFEEQSNDSGERITVYLPPGRRDERLLLATPTGDCRS